MTKILDAVFTTLWGVPAVVLILGVGLYLTVITGCVQLRLFPAAVRAFCSRFRDESNSSPFQALCTALAATVGTGNLVGVAGAICIGGPGAVFWMWVCGFVGMATKYAEAALAVRYQVGESGGPMYMISRGMGKQWTWLAKLYCAFGILACFGVGNTVQINTIVTGLNAVLLECTASVYRNFLIGLVLAFLIGLTLLGGVKRIGQAAQWLVPVTAAAYILLCVIVLFVNRENLPGAFQMIFTGAFSPKAATGGMIGSAFSAMRIGCSRGVFTNEAGMGTASIAHGGAKGIAPVQQGMLGILEVFLDTIVICTLTALVILCSGVIIPYGNDQGILLTQNAFCSVYGEKARILLTVCACSFAFATVLGWGLYGTKCAEFLFGKRILPAFSAVQIIVVLIGAVVDTKTVWQFSELFNGLMVIPNLLALTVLSPELRRFTREYISGSHAANGGTYANFNQCQPLRAFSHAEIPSAGSGRKAAGKENLPSEHRPARFGDTSCFLRSDS